jgi:hypothetical protein
VLQSRGPRECVRRGEQQEWECGMHGLRASDHLSVATTFETRAAATRLPRLKANLLKLARVYREMAAQAEDRRLVRKDADERSFRPG